MLDSTTCGFTCQEKRKNKSKIFHGIWPARAKINSELFCPKKENEHIYFYVKNKHNGNTTLGQATVLDSQCLERRTRRWAMPPNAFE